MVVDAAEKRKLTDTGVNFGQWFDRVANSIKEGFDKLNAWFERPETQEAFRALLAVPELIRERVRLQRRFLKAGLLPSGPLRIHLETQALLTGAAVAGYYANALEELGFCSDSVRLRRIATLVALGEPVYSLRVIFPELEAVARQSFYAPGVDIRITSLIEMRLRILDLQTEEPVGVAVRAMAVEPFVFINLSAIEYTYARSNEELTHKFRRAFEASDYRVIKFHNIDYASNGL